MGACEALGGSILLDAFGVVALVAMTPLITIQLMGLSYRRKLRRHAAVLEEGRTKFWNTTSPCIKPGR